MTRQVVITGLGAVTPSGLTADALWQSVVEGRSAIRVLEGDAFAQLPVRIGGQVRGFDTETILDRTLAKRVSPVQHWAIAAADEALGHAGVASRALPWNPDRVSVIAATGSGPVDAMQQATRAYDSRGARGVPLTLSMHGAPDSAAALLSQRHGIRGAAQAVSATCASGAVALGEGMRRIRHGYADAVLVVGMEDCLGPVHLSSNANMRALAAGYEEQPEAASMPFDRNRSGFVMSQGAAAVRLESDDAAAARGAETLAVLSGFGSSSDAHHPTAPHPEGRGAAQAVREGLADAGMTADDVGHINAHGTSTPAGDAAEAKALAAVFGERLAAVPITATKSSTGHLLGASGVVEAVIAVQSLRTGLLPPTLNLDSPEFDLDFISGTARKQQVDTVLSTSFGFGGHNAALLLTHAQKGSL